MAQIINYRTQYTDIEFINDHLSKHEENEAWICGVLDFASGELIKRRSRPDLDSEIVSGQFQIFGRLTYDIKDEIKRFGGKWDPGVKRWSLPTLDRDGIANCLASIDKVLSELGYEPDDVYYPEFKLGIPWSAWIYDYNRGKAWAERNGGKIRKDNTFHKRK